MVPIVIFPKNNKIITALLLLTTFAVLLEVEVRIRPVYHDLIEQFKVITATSDSFQESVIGTISMYSPKVDSVTPIPIIGEN